MNPDYSRAQVLSFLSVSGIHDCSEFAFCSDYIGRWDCECWVGWAGDGVICEQVNECEVLTYNRETKTQSYQFVDSRIPPPNTCHSTATCIDTRGSYECKCDDGYTGDGTACYDIDECALFLHDCPEHSSCVNEEPLFKCYCGKGYEKQNGLCVDIDECSGINEVGFHISLSVLIL